MKVRKAVIVAAGLGTRLLPASKVVPKEILPVVDTPAIQLVVDEAASSGLNEIIIVVSPRRRTVLEHFAPAPELERHLESRGKHDLLRLIRGNGAGTRIVAVEQHEPLGLGHAVLSAREAVGREAFALFLPDDIFETERPCARQLLDVAAERDAAVVALLRVGRSDLAKFGIVEAKPIAQRLHQLSGMVEKPSPERAPSDLAIMGRYVLPPDVFGLIERTKPGVGGEIQLTDALAGLCQSGGLLGYEFEGVRHDLGDRVGFVIAQIAFGLKRPEVADRLRAYLASLAS